MLAKGGAAAAKGGGAAAKGGVAAKGGAAAGASKGLTQQQVSQTSASAKKQAASSNATDVAFDNIEIPQNTEQVTSEQLQKDFQVPENKLDNYQPGKSNVEEPKCYRAIRALAAKQSAQHRSLAMSTKKNIGKVSQKANNENKTKAINKGFGNVGKVMGGIKKSVMYLGAKTMGLLKKAFAPVGDVVSKSFGMIKTFLFLALANWVLPFITKALNFFTFIRDWADGDLGKGLSNLIMNLFKFGKDSIVFGIKEGLANTEFLGMRPFTRLRGRAQAPNLRDYMPASMDTMTNFDNSREARQERQAARREGRSTSLREGRVPNAPTATVADRGNRFRNRTNQEIQEKNSHALRVSANAQAANGWNGLNPQFAQQLGSAAARFHEQSGGWGIILTTGYRDAAENRRLSKAGYKVATNSPHSAGIAADINFIAPHDKAGASPMPLRSRPEQRQLFEAIANEHNIFNTGRDIKTNVTHDNPDGREDWHWEFNAGQPFPGNYGRADVLRDMIANKPASKVAPKDDDDRISYEIQAGIKKKSALGKNDRDSEKLVSSRDKQGGLFGKKSTPVDAAGGQALIDHNEASRLGIDNSPAFADYVQQAQSNPKFFDALGTKTQPSPEQLKPPVIDIPNMNPGLLSSDPDALARDPDNIKQNELNITSQPNVKVTAHYDSTITNVDELGEEIGRNLAAGIIASTPKHVEPQRHVPATPSSPTTA